MTKLLGVGIIGASPERGRAKESHVPAVQKLAGLELVAVATGSQPSADAATRAFGAKADCGNAEDLIGNPDVDIVTVAVKVPDHRKLVLGAPRGFQSGRLRLILNGEEQPLNAGFGAFA